MPSRDGDSKPPLVGRQQRVLNYCILVGNYEVGIQVRDGLVVALLVDVWLGTSKGLDSSSVRWTNDQKVFFDMCPPLEMIDLDLRFRFVGFV